MRLDAGAFRYLTREEFRVLVAVEMGMRNHELVPTPLIESIAKLNRGGTFKILQVLLRHKLVAHDGKKYDSYRLTYHGFDFLALRALVMRGSISGVGRRLGVGKESDVHFCQGPDGELLALKLHRLGRISFRNIKQKRDYLQHRTHASWMYMARLAAAKEFAYMKALRDEGFPVPKPIDQNRHAVVMSFLRATPLYHIRQLVHPHQVLERLMRLLVRLGRAGIIHGDFNEFNLMVAEDEKVTLIDFPQIVHLNHPNAEEFFERDVTSICEYFRKKIGIQVERWPTFKEVLEEVAANGKGALDNIAIEGVGLAEDQMLVAAHEKSRQSGPEVGHLSGEEDDDDEDSEDEEAEVSEEEHAGDAQQENMENSQTEVGDMQQLVPIEGRGALSFAEDDLEEPKEDEPKEDSRTGDQPPEANACKAENAEDEEGEEDNSTDSEASEGPGQVKVSTGKKVRRRHTAKDARKNLQKQQKQKPARANNQKVKEARRARNEIREYL